VTGEDVVLLPPTKYYAQHKEMHDTLENTIIMTVIPFISFIVVTIATIVTAVTLKRMIAWREGAAGHSASKKSQVTVRFGLCFIHIF
jgi:hypothetical protein